MVVLIGFVCCDLSTKLWTVDIIVSNALFAGSEIPERSASYMGTSGDVASRVNSWLGTLHVGLSLYCQVFGETGGPCSTLGGPGRQDGYSHSLSSCIGHLVCHQPFA